MKTSAISHANDTTRLFLGVDMKQPEHIACVAGNVVALSRTCPGVDINDDCAAVIETESGDIVLVVADGMGGGPVGHKASLIAVESVARSVNEAATDSDLRPAILDGIESANRHVLELGVGAATTLSVVEIRNGIARAYQVGDSMILMVGQRGLEKWKSTSHSPVGYAIESGMLDEADAMHHENRHFVSNMVGSDDMHIEIGPARHLSRRDTVIVASDGLSDNLRLDEIVRWGRIGKPVERVSKLAAMSAERMRDAFRGNVGEPGKPDDLTILMFTF